MAIHCEFVDFIIPISKIDLVYPGGFKTFKKEHIKGFSRRLKDDNFIFRDGAMNPMDIQNLVNKWEGMGVKGIAEINGQKQWVDFCVVEGMFGGPTLPCDWLEYDNDNNCVYLKNDILL